jgi:hypothetical protein
MKNLVVLVTLVVYVETQLLVAALCHYRNRKHRNVPEINVVMNRFVTIQ